MPVNPLILKTSVVGLGGVTVIVGTVVGMSKSQVQTEPLQEEVIEKTIRSRKRGKRFLSSDSSNRLSPHWKEAGAKYKENNKNAPRGGDDFQLEDGKGPISDVSESLLNEAPQSFLKACEERTKNVSLDSPDLSEDVINYCTKNTTILDLVAESGKFPLSILSQPSIDSGKKAWERYRIDNREASTDVGKLKDFALNREKESFSEAPSDFREKCNAYLTSTNIEDEVLLGQVMKGCTIED